MSDQECVSAMVDALIKLQNKHSRFLLEHFPRNLLQAQLFSVQFIEPIRCIQTACSFSHIQRVEGLKAEPRSGAELIALEREYKQNEVKGGVANF